MSEIPPFLHDTLAGRYVIKREIGRGGSATVFLAEDVRHERSVAIKLLHRELSHALGAQRFLREIKLTASLQHPHILSIYDSGEVAGQLYYVMPYVEGKSLRQRLGGDNRLSIDEAVRIGREIAGSLAYAHERGVVHRDIKPDNVLFSGGHAVIADFGIAREIDRAHEQITQQGTITGTPAYMSPEQARDRAFDGRSDVYSLACVLYEAMAGVPPFVGDTPRQLLTQRLTKPAPLLREYRHDIPPQIEAVIAKALATSPDDRFDDARAFSAALSTAIGNSGETLTMRTPRRPLLKSPWLWAAAIALMTTGAAATERGRDRFDLIAGRVDDERYAVLPFQYVGAAAPVDEQEPVAQSLYTAMREWADLKLASDVSVSDAMHGSREHTMDAAMAAARHVRSGKAIWGRVSLSRDSIHVRAAVYDAISGASLRELTVSGRRDMLDKRPGALRTLAVNLLRLNGVPLVTGDEETGTRSLAAWRAYQEGQRALARWQVKQAREAFERASTIDPEYPQAQVWLAQLMLWHAEPPAVWAVHSSAASKHNVSLGDRDAALLTAMEEIQSNRHGDACTTYRQLSVRDSLDVAAWLGLAHCQIFDKLVVRREDTGSGWAFRSSISSAQRAYARALTIAPAAFSAFPTSLLRQLYIVESSIYRKGATADGTQFFGMPDLRGDTLAYSARPLKELTGVSASIFAPAIDVALAKNRESLLALLTTLTQHLPDNADVFEALASVLETRGDITGTPNGGYSALSALDRAIALATDTIQRARLGAFDVRLHLKLGDFARTEALGDSILNHKAVSTGRGAVYLAGIASLLGREHLATQYFRAAGESVSLPGAPPLGLVEEVSTALFVRAGLGVCDDSLRTLEAHVESLLESYASATQRDAARRALLGRPAQFAVACFGTAPALAFGLPDATPTHELRALARGDVQYTRAVLDSFAVLRRFLRPGEVALDLTLTESWIHLQLGDTLSAVRELDLTLMALPGLSSYIVREPGMASAVGRAMVMRAEIASSRGDAGTASLWAGRVLTLWARSDPSLAPTLGRMRAMVTHRA